MSSIEEEESQPQPAPLASATSEQENPALQTCFNLEELKVFLESHPDPEEQIRTLLHFMKISISQKGGPTFKAFWDAKKICIEAFKKNLPPSARNELWSQYVEVSKEARRLKDLLDEQSHFAVEQIEKAIEAIENDLASMAEILEKVTVFEEKEFPLILTHSFQEYQNRQKELNLLNAYASRVTELRKELIKTDMRIRKKNSLFQRLSSLGDQVFPRRKLLIKETSDFFEKDVEGFFKQNFADPEEIPFVFELREQIKLLQSFAKILTLNTHAFNRTRLLLSQCWDQLNQWDKELKKKRAEKKQVFKDNLEGIQQKVSELQKSWEESTLSPEEAWNLSEDYLHEIRRTELAREDVKALRDILQKVRDPIEAKKQEEEEFKRREREEERRRKEEELVSLQNRLDILIEEAKTMDVGTLSTSVVEIQQGIEVLSRQDKALLTRKLRPVKDLLHEKKEEELLSDDDKQALEKYREILEERKRRRNLIKEQVEQLRKASGTSGLDFEQSMNQQTQLKEEKERLDKLDHSIQELQNKIRRLQP